MANGWSALEVSKPQTIGASATNTAVTKEYPITAGGSIHHVIAIDVTTVTVAAGITAKLQTAINDIWVDSKTAAITVAGRVYIKLNVEVAGDQTYLPLLNKGRVVISTGAGDAVTVTAVNILQEL